MKSPHGPRDRAQGEAGSGKETTPGAGRLLNGGRLTSLAFPFQMDEREILGK